MASLAKVKDQKDITPAAIDSEYIIKESKK
jgi:hypothetical protein